MRKISRRNRIFLRAFCMTMFMFMCLGTALVSMGHVYAVIEQNAHGREVTALSVTEMDYLNLFGKEIYFPVMSISEKVYAVFKQYSPGIIKLLSFAVNGTEELINTVIQLI